MIIAVCILIVAIPEGMPLAISLAMALSIDKLKDDSILIKNLEAIQICATLHDVCIGKTGTLTANRMEVGKIALINQESIIDYDKKDRNFLENIEIPNELKDVVKQAIIGGTEAWLNVNNDEEHMIDEKKPLKGYKPTDTQMKDGPYGPYHEPKGNDIERALLQFLLNNDEDVHQMLIDRNRN